MSNKAMNIWTGLPAVFLLCSGLFTAGAIAADDPPAAFEAAQANS